MVTGVVLGMILGLHAESSEWAGGYASLKRRALRLGHISAIALPALCVLYGANLDSTALTPSLKTVGCWLMLVGAFSMPLVCIGTAFVNRVKFLFPIPATSVLLGLIIMLWGQIQTAIN